jgi:drug/metabolite transporter (DMT)-like permease
MLFGIVMGLGAACGQSFSYISTRHYVQRRPAGASRQLLVLGHLWMGLLALIALPFVWPAGGIDLATIAWPLFFATLFYIVGQIGLTMALKYAEPSRVSPLLTFKLFVPALLASLWGQPVGATTPGLTIWQWLAVIICVTAAYILNLTGGTLKKRAILGLVLATTVFACSDWSIGCLIRALLQLPHMNNLHASLLAEAISYLTTGLLAIPLLAWQGTKKPRDWLDAAPFGLTWYIAMVCLFLAFSEVGVLLGSILQCTRGFINILLAGALIHLGHEHIEPLHAPGILLKRLAAGLLMFIGITLYVIRDPAQFKIKAGAYEGSLGKGAKIVSIDAYHELLTSRYVCESCLTRYFAPRRFCAACKQFGRIRPLQTHLQKLADNDADLRKMIARGQYFIPPTNKGRNT